MKTKFILAASISALAGDQVSAISIKTQNQYQGKQSITHKFSNRDNEDGADEYDRLEEANENSLEYNDILQYSENVKDGKISEVEQVKVLDKATEQEEKEQDQRKRNFISQSKMIMTTKPTAAFKAQQQATPPVPALAKQPLPKAPAPAPVATAVKQSLVQQPATPQKAAPVVAAAPAVAPKTIMVQKGVKSISLKKIDTKTLSAKPVAAAKAPELQKNVTQTSPTVKPVEKPAASPTPAKQVEAPKVAATAEKKPAEAPKVTADKPAHAAPASPAASTTPANPANPQTATAAIATPAAAVTAAAAPAKATPAQAKPEQPKVQNLAKKRSSSEMKKKLKMKKTKHATSNQEDPYDFYNEQLPTSDNDIYNIGDQTQKQISKNLIKQQNIVAQNQILDEDQKLAEVIQENSNDEIDRSVVEMHTSDGINLDSLIDKSTSEYIESQKIKEDILKKENFVLLNKPKNKK